MCSNAGSFGPPTRPEADLAARLAAAIDELAAAASSQVGTGRVRAGADSAGEARAGEARVGQDHADQDHADQDRAYRDRAESDLAERLARAWAMITAADPEVAARTARYSRP